MSDRCQHKGQPRRGGGRALYNQQPAIFGLGQVFKRLGNGKIILLKIGFIVIDANITKINRQGAILGIQLKGFGDICQLW